MENGERYGAVDIEFNLGSLSFVVFLALLQVNPNCHPESHGKIEYQTSLYQYSYSSCLESQQQNA